ncbi:hypothetical protein BDF20DRAFT_912109 [Mycotypha africana]|uniref:uncharacterized protein n=1 Tax=Mycotypha africana TaxID=64632 RepID=UPI002301574D|nr:uncharacterized protein BDF20DRAFT_912109 [Mycotypha africana]KAI8981881.1 hypothetical protein BDF20DRAFT_912109 [Mycotypha africana]
MTLPFFFNKPGVINNKKKKPTTTTEAATAATADTTTVKDTLYPTLSSLIQRTSAISIHEPISIPHVQTASSFSNAIPTTTVTTTRTTTVESEEPADEDMDENFFYRHLTTHFHPLFVESSIICIPHTKSIQGLVLTKDIIESHCFLPSPYFCGQYMATKQRHKNIALDYPLITTLGGYQKEKMVHVLAEETVSYKHKKIKLYLIDQLLEGETPKYHPLQHYKPTITIPPIRNSKNDLEFLNIFPQNFEAIHELQLVAQEFTDSYVYVKGYNKCTVERIQHIYMKAYKTILKRNQLLEESCRIPSEHDRFLELVENISVVMSFLYKKVWKQSLPSLLASQDNHIQHLSQLYFNVPLSQFALRYPISEMDRSCFQKAIGMFQQLNSPHYASVLDPHAVPSSTEAAFTPLEKLAALKSTLNILSDTVTEFIQHFEGNTAAAATKGIDSASLTSDELIPLLAYVMIQSQVGRIASMIYYMQHYRLARMQEGSVYNFVLATMKAACEFLKDDPLSLQQKYQQQQLDLVTLSERPSLPAVKVHERKKRPSSIYSMRSTQSTANHSPLPAAMLAATTPSSAKYTLHHRKSQSADLSSTSSTSSIASINNTHSKRKPSSSPAATLSPNASNTTLRPQHFVLPQSHTLSQNRKSLDIPNDWLLPSTHTNSNVNNYNYIPSPTSPSSTVSISSTATNTTTSPLSPLSTQIPPVSLSLSPSLSPQQQKKPFHNHHLNSTKPLISTTFPSLSSSTPLLNNNDSHPGEESDITNNDSISNSSLSINIPKLGRSLSASTNNDSHQEQQRQQQSTEQHPRYFSKRSYQRKAPTVINLNLNRLSFLSDHHHRPLTFNQKRPASICLDTRSFHNNCSSNSCNSSVYSADNNNDTVSTTSSSTTATTKEELMGDFLLGLSQLDGDVVGGRSGTLRTTSSSASFKK